MRITTQLLKKATSHPLHEVEYVDLSNQEIVAIERLSPCRKLQTLILRNNSIDSIRNIECCRQLWHIDLTGNKVKSLHGLSRFPVLGMLSVAFNDLDWPEVRSLSHIRLVSLTLTGNTKLDSNPHYREHVVDLLPHLWVLDGVLITADERKRVVKFFSKSQTSDNPVRRKSSDSVFVPSSLKNLMVTGVFGEKSTHLMSRFPVNYAHNIEMDKHRLKYLAYTLQKDAELWAKYKQRSTTDSPTPPPTPRFESLLEHREQDIEQCNMLLLLLLAFLEHNLPLDVMRSTLETAKLTSIGEVNCIEVLTLPPDLILHYVSLLLNAAVISRQENKEGGLYDKLFQSLCYTRDRVHRKVLSHQTIAKRHSPARKCSPVDEAKHSHLRCLLASEVVHLMCLVPLFFERLEKHQGLLRMVVIATKNPNVADVIGNLAWKVQARGGDVWEVYHDVAGYLLQTTSENVAGKRRPMKRSTRVYRTTSQLIQSTQSKAPPTYKTRAMSAGAVSRKLRSRVGLKGLPPAQGFKEPEIGDMVFVSAEQSARIVALPESRVAVLQMSNKVVACPPDAYLYADTHGLVWDEQQGYWTKDNLVADLSTGRLSATPPPDYPSSFSTLPLYASTTSLEGSVSTLRSSTPESFQNSHSVRPHSQMSFLSDDLQTIPSQEELEIEESVPTLSMRVDIATSGSAQLHDASKTDSQCSSYLHQNVAESDERGREIVDLATSLHHQGNAESTSIAGRVPSELRIVRPEEVQETYFHRNHRKETITSVEPQSFSEHSSSGGGGGGFIVPTPQLHLSDIWESGKSVPTASHSSSKRTHSCHHIEFQRQVSKVEPHMPPSSSPTHHQAPPTSTNPALSASISTLSLKSSLGHMTPSHSAEPAGMAYQPVMYNAWTIATPSAPSTKHTASSRLMTKRHPKIPPIAGKTDLSSHWHGNSKSSPGTVVLQQKPSTHHQANLKPQSHMPAYSAHAERSVGRYHYHPPRPRAQTPSKNSTRKLGDMGNIYIGGTSIG